MNRIIPLLVLIVLLPRQGTGGIIGVQIGDKYEYILERINSVSIFENEVENSRDYLNFESCSGSENVHIHAGDYFTLEIFKLSTSCACSFPFKINYDGIEFKTNTMFGEYISDIYSTESITELKQNQEVFYSHYSAYQYANEYNFTILDTDKVYGYLTYYTISDVKYNYNLSSYYYKSIDKITGMTVTLRYSSTSSCPNENRSTLDERELNLVNTQKSQSIIENSLEVEPVIFAILCVVILFYRPKKEKF